MTDFSSKESVMPKHPEMTDPLTFSPNRKKLCHPDRSRCIVSRSNGGVEGLALRKCLNLLTNAATFLSTAILLVLLTSQSSLACSDSSFPTQIGRNFKVEVFDRGKPVEGLEIELSTASEGQEKSHTVLIVKTNAEGSAEFKSVKPRLYYLGIKHPAFASSIILKVMRRPPKKDSDTVTFHWPGWKPLSTQYVAGSLTGRARTSRPTIIDMTSPPVYSVVPGATLTLFKAVSGEVVSSQPSQEAGKFEFKGIPAGLYMLRVETPVLNPVHWIYPTDGYVPIEVDPASQFTGVDLELDNAICGELAWGRPEGKPH